MLTDIELKDVCPCVHEVQTVYPQDVKAWVFMICVNEYDDYRKPLEVRSYVNGAYLEEDDARRALYNEYKRWQTKNWDAERILNHCHIGRRHSNGVQVLCSITKRPVY